MSAVFMVGFVSGAPGCTGGTMNPSLTSRGCHCLAPAGDSTTSHSWAKIVSRYLLSHCVGVGVHAPSRPDVMVYSPNPVSFELAQPKPNALSSDASGSKPTPDSGELPC